jgi:hypothetical protein
MIGGELLSLGFNPSLGSGINMIREPRDGRTTAKGFVVSDWVGICKNECTGLAA